MRVGHAGNSIYLDLCNDAGEIVELTADGWKITQQAPVKFERPRGMLPLPRPVTGGSIDDLRPLLPRLDEESWILVASWLLGAMNSDGPYPILSVIGEAGSAKSTMCRLLRNVLDPRVGDLRMMPKTARDLAIAASHAHLLVFDNVSHLQPAHSDALCQIATGASFGTRQLFTDGDEILIRVQHPILFNGIDEFVERTDLRDRCIRIDLPHLDEGRRRPERALYREFVEVHPQVLGALCDAVCPAIRNRDQAAPMALPRMADFAGWVVAAEPALPWAAGEFIRAMNANSRRALRAGLGGDAICGAINDLVPPGADQWEGTAGALHGLLHVRIPSDARRSARFPSNTMALVSRLRRIAPDMRSAMGIDITVVDAGQRVAIRRLLA